MAYNADCYSGGCNNLTTICVASSCNFYINCDDAIASTLCPNGYELPIPFSFPSLLDIEFSTYDNSHKTCFNPATNALNCDDYKDNLCYNNGELTATSNPSPICCTGYQIHVSIHQVLQQQLI